jgi:hypothetical protein
MEQGEGVVTPLSLRLSGGLLFILLSTQAWATNWVTGDGWIWTDMDSVSRSGGFVYVNVAHGVEEEVPPDVGGGEVFQQRINCATREVRNMTTDYSFIADAGHYYIATFCP